MSQDKNTEEDKLEEVAETLESNEEQKTSSKAEVYEQAYDEWQENDNTELLENLIHQESLKHKYHTLSKIRKKGEYTNYDKLDAGLSGALLSSASYVVHPVLASLWILSFLKILSDSFGNIESENIYSKFDDFGPELFYYIVFSLAAGFIFHNILGYTVVLENGGTLPTILYEVMHFVK